MSKEKETKEVFEEYTLYEQARILGARALQISANAPILIKLSEEQLKAMNYDPIKIAELEFKERILPITVKRPLPKKIEKPLVEAEEKEVVVEEKELPKEEVKVEEKAKVEEAAETEAEEGEAEEEVAEELEKATEELEEASE
jgi:DNA-directed RNA polymerase subunit K